LPTRCMDMVSIWVGYKLIIDFGNNFKGYFVLRPQYGFKLIV